MDAISQNRIQLPAGVSLIGLGVLWGASFPAIDVVVSQLPPLGAAGIRYGFAGIVILAYAAATTDRLFPQTAPEVLGVALVGVFMFGGYQGGLFLGTQYVSGAVAAVVVSASPVVAAAIAVPLLGESRGVVDLCGFVLGLVGVGVISQPSPDAGGLSTTGVGVALVFAGAALFAVGSVTIQIVDGDLPLEALQGWAMLVGATVLFTGAFLRGESVSAGSVSALAVGSLLYITLVAGAAGYLLYFRLVRRVGATETTLVAYLEPVFATVVSILLFGNVVAPATVIGFLAVVGGFAVISREAITEAIGARSIP